MIVIPFLSFKGMTHAYLKKISITRNKIYFPLTSLFSNYISARSAAQILSIKDECIFIFSNFLATGLCSSSDNSLLDVISYLIARPKAYPIETTPF